MLPQVICIILVINTFNGFLNAIPYSEFNETKLLLSINSQLTELRAEQEKQKKIGLDNAEDVRFLRADIQFIKADVKALRSDLEKEKTDRESDIKTLRAELALQRKVLDDLLYRSYSENCGDVKTNGVYDILLPNFSKQPFKVACDAQFLGGGWTIVLKRIDGSVDFYRNWNSYKNGFGDINGEFFLGLDKIYAMTSENAHEIVFVIEDFEHNERYELYDKFAIGHEHEQYVLHTLGRASGTAGDAVSYYLGMKFTTFDRDNDLWAEGNCANDTFGAWWYKNHRDSQLTGIYNDTREANGIKWYSFRGSRYSLKKAVMMIRPKK